MEVGEHSPEVGKPGPHGLRGGLGPFELCQALGLHHGILNLASSLAGTAQLLIQRGDSVSGGAHQRLRQRGRVSLGCFQGAAERADAPFDLRSLAHQGCVRLLRQGGDGLRGGGQDTDALDDGILHFGGQSTASGRAWSSVLETEEERELNDEPATGLILRWTAEVLAPPKLSPKLYREVGRL
jgi:hypothetical protein